MKIVYTALSLVIALASLTGCGGRGSTEKRQAQAEPSASKAAGTPAGCAKGGRASINAFNASPQTVNAGQSSALYFNVCNTTSRSVTDLATGAVTSLDVEDGTISVTPATSRSYRLMAADKDGFTTLDLTIRVEAGK